MDQPFEREATEEERTILSKGWSGKPDLYWLDFFVGITGGLLAAAPFIWLFQQLGLSQPVSNIAALILGQLCGAAWIYRSHLQIRRIYDAHNARGRAAFEAGTVWEWDLEVVRCWEVDIVHDRCPGFVLQAADGRALYVQDQGFFDGHPDELEVPLRRVRAIWQPLSRRLLTFEMSGEPVTPEEDMATELYDDEGEQVEVGILEPGEVEALLRPRAVA